MHISYLMPLHHVYPDCWLHPGAIHNLVAALYLHKQHTYTHNITQSNHYTLLLKPNYQSPYVTDGDHTFNYIYQLNITQSVHYFDHKA
jgi:hypothetical protein